MKLNIIKSQFNEFEEKQKVPKAGLHAIQPVQCKLTLFKNKAGGVGGLRVQERRGKRLAILDEGIS